MHLEGVSLAKATMYGSPDSLNVLFSFIIPCHFKLYKARGGKPLSPNPTENLGNHTLSEIERIMQKLLLRNTNQAQQNITEILST